MNDEDRRLRSVNGGASTSSRPPPGAIILASAIVVWLPSVAAMWAATYFFGWHVWLGFLVGAYFVFAVRLVTRAHQS